MFIRTDLSEAPPWGGGVQIQRLLAQVINIAQMMDMEPNWWIGNGGAVTLWEFPCHMPHACFELYIIVGLMKMP